MGRDLYEGSPAARKVMESLRDHPRLENLPSIIFDGPEELLTRTDNVQPAITTVSLMAWAAIQERADKCGLEVVPQACAGHSLGEYAAHAAAGNLIVEQAISLTGARGRWMNEASQPPHPKGAMVALMGLGLDKVREIVQATGGGWVAVANINSPGQIILSGEEQALARTGEAASAAGAKRVIPLNVSGAWHSPLMREAQSKMTELLQQLLSVEKISFNSKIPVIANATSDRVGSLEDMIQTLCEQITSPVIWTETVRRLLTVTGYPGLPSEASGIERDWPLFVEVGPGKVLRGLLRGIDRGIETVGVEDMASLDEFIGML